MGRDPDGARELSFSQLVLPDLTGDVIVVSGNEARHLLKSLRGRIGDRVRATDGRGCLASLEVTETNRTRATLRVRQRENVEMPSRRWWLAALAAGARFDWLVEKAVELGAWSVLPLTAETTKSRRSERWQRVADAALGQCQAAWGLQVGRPEALEKLLESPPCERWAAVVWADPGGRRAGDIDPAALPSGDLLLVSGPPEGFSRAQQQALQRFGGGFAISLGDRRLRSETAALAGLVWARCTGRSQESFKPSG